MNEDNNNEMEMPEEESEVINCPLCAITGHKDECPLCKGEGKVEGVVKVEHVEFKPGEDNPLDGPVTQMVLNVAENWILSASSAQDAMMMYSLLLNSIAVKIALTAAEAKLLIEEGDEEEFLDPDNWELNPKSMIEFLLNSGAIRDGEFMAETWDKYKTWQQVTELNNLFHSSPSEEEKAEKL